MIASLVALAALATPAPSGPMAVFWSGGRTWRVDVDAGRLSSAPGWITSDESGLWRYRLRVDTARPRTKAPIPRAASRWTVFERLGPDDRSWRPLTRAPEVPAEGSLFDEQQVVRFMGDAVSWMRYRRVDDGAGSRGITAQTLSLPDGRPRAMPEGAQAALDWLGRTVPGAIEPCVDAPAGMLTFDRGGQRADWLVLAGAGACADRAHALPLSRRHRLPLPLSGALWVDDTLRVDGRPDLDRVVDLRSTLAGRVAVALRGPALPEADRVQRDLGHLDDPCVDREVIAWRAGQAPKTVGRAPRLDGLRWLGPHDPLRAASGWFREADEPCAETVSFEDAPPMAGHLCRVDESERPWRGPSDLAASATGRWDGAALIVDVAVRDADRSDADAVRLYLGDRRRPDRVRVTAEEVEYLGSRRVRRRLGRQVRATWSPTPEGYAVRVELERLALGDTPSLSVAIYDQDPGDPGPVILWAVGRPIDGRNPRATPLEAP